MEWQNFRKFCLDAIYRSISLGRACGPGDLRLDHPERNHFSRHFQGQRLGRAAEVLAVLKEKGLQPLAIIKV